jgi:multidrug resistance efflux pump
VGLLLYVQTVGANPLVVETKDAMVFSGTLEARLTRVSPEVSARVVQVSVVKGQTINAGDTLVAMDDSSIKLTLAEADSAVRAAQANLDQVKEAARPANVDLAKAGVAQAEADLGAAKSALADANRTLTAPQDLTAQMHAVEARVQANQGEVGQAEAALASIKQHVDLAQRDQSGPGKFRLAATQYQQESAEATLAAAKATLAGNQRLLTLYRQSNTMPHHR